MDDADAPEHFVRDIDANLNATWRWSAKNPAIRIRPHTAEHLKYVVELAVPEATFRATGAVTIAFSLNGKLLDRVKYDKPGTHTFEKPVEPGWLKADEDATLSAEIDKTYLDNGTPRGFIIVSMGLANSTVPSEKP